MAATGAQDRPEERHSYLAAARETALGLSERYDPGAALERIITRAAEIAGTPHGFVYLVEPSGEEIALRFATGRFAPHVGQTLRRGEGLSGRVWETGAPLAVADYATWPGRAERYDDQELRSVFGVPLVSAGMVIGVLGLAYTEPGRSAGEAQLDLVRRIGDLVAIALDNARLYAKAKQELVERARAERELAAAQVRYRALIEQIPAVAYSEIHEIGGSWQYVSPQIESLLGYTPEEVGQPSFWKGIVHPDDLERVLAEDELCERTGKPWRMDYRLVARDGRVLWVRDHAVLVRDEDGRPSYWQGLWVDVTEQKLAEQALTDALEREREAAAGLRALDEMKNTFLDAVSHELRTPLAAVMGIALTLQRSVGRLSEQDVADLLGRLVASAGKLDRLLTDLLDLDRLSRGIVAPKLRSTDVTALVARVGEEWRRSSRRWLGVDAEQVVARVDPGKVERIVENLLANAARHTATGIPVWVRLCRRPEGVLLTVEDAGAGVPPELRASVFEPFRQGPDAPTHAPGVGIGLSLVARFAELHGGRAWVEEREGGGSSFRVLLPDDEPRVAPGTG